MRHECPPAPRLASAAWSATRTASFHGIVEEKDATPDQRAITEVNLSTYVFRPEALLVGPQAVDGE